MKPGGGRRENQHDPEGAPGDEREGPGLAKQLPTDIPSWMEEEHPECHPRLLPPSILSSPVPSLPRLPGRWEGLAVSPDVSLESEGRDSSGSFLRRYSSETICIEMLLVA